jgi:hypothetical protein
MTGEEWVVGGQPFYGQEVGVLLLDAPYPRLPGDVGHAATYRWPVQFEIVEGLTADRLIHHFDDGIPPLVARSVDRLAQRGARVVVGGCGFFARVHAYVRQRSKVPFLSSSLLQVPWLRMLYGDPIGVLTIDAEALDDRYIGDCGWSRRDPVVIEGIDPASMFARVYFENRDRFDPRQMEADVVAAARRLAARAPEVKAVVLECTNMAPFAAAVQRVLPVPLYDIQGLADFAALATHRYPYSER